MSGREPQWTVHYNIVSPESDRWIGDGWEFFDEEDQADRCFSRHRKAGNCPTKRPFYRVTDIHHLGAAHGYWLRRELRSVEVGCNCKPPADDPHNQYFSCPHGVRGPEGVQGPHQTAER